MARTTIWEGVDSPKNTCTDENCPFHGNVSLRGRPFIGKVVSSKAQRTATISWTRRVYHRKYERYLNKTSKIHAHNPACINANEGDKVLAVETRPLSKTKHFAIIKVMSEQPKKTAKKKP